MNVPLVSAMAYSGGDWVIYLLLACSILAVAVIVERGIVVYRENKALGRLAAALDSGSADLKAIDKAAQVGDGAALRVARAAFSAGRARGEIDEVLNEAANRERPGLEKRLLILGTLGNNAPFIGLLGTVLGVIKAFHDLAITSAGPEVVMSGLSQALVATATGLFVAIPCVIAFNFFQKKTRDLLSETDTLCRSALRRPA